MGAVSHRFIYVLYASVLVLTSATSDLVQRHANCAHVPICEENKFSPYGALSTSAIDIGCKIKKKKGESFKYCKRNVYARASFFKLIIPHYEYIRTNYYARCQMTVCLIEKLSVILLIMNNSNLMSIQMLLK